MSAPAPAVTGAGPLRLAQVALHVADIDRADAFFGEVLGLPRLFRSGALAFFEAGGVRLMLEGDAATAAAAPPTAGTCHYFRVDDIGAAFDALHARGAAFVDTPHLVARMPDHELWMCFFHDPDGHLLALMEERRDAPPAP